MAKSISSRRQSRTIVHDVFRKYCKLSLSLLEDRSVPSITGTVFQDFNANGLIDTGPVQSNTGLGSSPTATDRGLGGVSVTAFDSNNAVAAAATTNADGTYSLATNVAGPYRVEFTNLPLGVSFGPQGPSNGSSVQFVGGPNAFNVNLSLVRPEDYSPNNPNIVTSQYFVGGTATTDLNPGATTIISFPYNAGSTDSDPIRPNHQIGAHDLQISQMQVGATWGLGYDSTANRIFAAAYMKRTTGFGPGGPGAIYTTGTTGSTGSLYADLNSIFPGDFPAGNLNSVFTDQFGNSVPFRNNITSSYDWFRDGLTRVEVAPGVFRDVGWDSVGKIALGGLDVSDDGSRIFVMALGDRRLYSLPTGGPLNASTVFRYDLPLPPTVTGTAASPLGDLRPFAVEVHRGIVYVGAVNSAESTQNDVDLRAYVFAFDPAIGQFVDSQRRTTTTEAVFEFSLNYPRGQIHVGFDADATFPGGFTPPDPAEWNAWVPEHRTVQTSTASLGRSSYPQPMLTGLSFDADGNLSIGLRDRSGDQIGRNVPIDPAQPNNYSPFSITAGDTLRAFINAPRSLDIAGSPFTGWTLESNSRGPAGQGTGPINNGQGPGNGEYYFDDDYPRDPSTTPVGVDTENDEVSMGAVLQLPGFNQTIGSAFDPVRLVGAINGGGFRWYDNQSGAVARTYELYVTATNANTSTFAKGNGLGDLIAITGAAPIEVGNFVWSDANRNGIQDAGEAGLANVTIGLYNSGSNGIFGDSDDSLVATATTDANGNYLFSSGTGTSTGSRRYGLGLSVDSNYQLRVNAPSGKAFTLQSNDPSINGTFRDSDVSGAGIVEVTTTFAGASDHTFDIGIVDAPNLALGDTVWNDLNNDGIKQGNEPGVDGVAVHLYAADGVSLIGSTVTAKGGRYLFTNLSAAGYIVEVVPPTGFVSSTGKIGSSTGPFEPGVINNNNDNDHGTNQPNGRIRSSTITIATPGDASNPDANGGLANTANLRVDFGLIRPLSIGNLVFHDVNNDGIRQDAEAGIGGVTIDLINVTTGQIVATTATNASGGYLFTNLTPDQYRVQLVRSTLPGPEYISSTGANGKTGPFEPANGTTVDSTDYGTTFNVAVLGPVINLNYTTQPLGETATAGGLIDNAEDANSNLRQDFGFIRTLSLGNLVWNDENNNGKRDPMERGVGGVSVRLLNSGGDAIGSTFTQGDGSYLFEGLFPGSYSVAIIPPNGFTSSTGSGLIRQRILTGPYEPAPLVNPNDNEDKGTLVGAEIRSNPVALFTAGSPQNPSLGGLGNTTVDFGLILRKNFISVPASVSGYVYRDTFVTDGLRAPAQGETGIVNVRVTLTGTDVDGKNVSLVRFTDSKGFYEFLDLVPGNYTITEYQPLGFLDGIDTLGSLSGTKPGNDVLTVTLNDDDHGIEYNFGEVLAASVFGYVYEDLNQNRRFDSGEPGIPNVLITISGIAHAGTPMAHLLTAADSLNGLTTRTDAFGRWEFPLLPAGLYKLVETQPTAYLDFFESVQEPRVRPVSVTNDVFDIVALDNGETRGPLNYGEIREGYDPTKKNFLGSSGGGVTPGIQPPVSTDPGDVSSTPAFSVNTGTPNTPAFVVTAAAAGRSPLLRVFDYSTGVERFRFFAYEENYTGGVRVATADINGDGVPDIVAATGQGGGPRIRVFSGTDGSILKDFFAFEPEFRGGVFVAAADVDGDGKSDILAGTELGGGPRLSVFSGADNTRIHDFFAFDSNQRGGLRVASADFNGDGKADLVATAGRGNQTRVRVFDGVTRALLSDFVPYDAAFTGGVFIAAGDVTGDGKADVITSADVGGGPHVQVFDNLTGHSNNSFFAEDSNYRGGIRLAAHDLDGDNIDEIITGTGPGGPAHIRLWHNGQSVSFEDFYAFDAAYTGGVYVG